ncbi:MAG: glycerophosphodiester phosphodiesterase [Candidatus Obscuribacterales bacterium]|nr:glycerophosphodiester phosphodiesterase [Candidatus Obscuribacterales bacterium]
MIESTFANRIKLPLSGTTPRGPLVIGHRGASLEKPENTIAAFLAAIDSGADAIELDVRRTIDGELVVIHDATVDRTTDGSGSVSQLSLAQIKRLDAGYRFTRDGGRTFPYRNQGIGVPTLAEVLSATDDTMIFLELKEKNRELADCVRACLVEHQALDRVLIQTICSSHKATKYLRSLDKRLLIGHSSFEIGLFFTLSLFRLGRLFKPRGPSFEVPKSKYGLRLLSNFFVKRAQKAGICVIVWTVDDRITLEKCLSLGVDGVISNNPSVLARLKQTKKGKEQI